MTMQTIMTDPQLGQLQVESLPAEDRFWLFVGPDTEWEQQVAALTKETATKLIAALTAFVGEAQQ